MIRGIPRDQHGILDFTYVPVVFAAPAFVGFKREKWASNLCRAMSITVLGYSLLTDAKWGLVKVIPYRTHAALDLSLGVAALASPLILDKAFDEPVSKKARNTLFLMGVTGVVVGLLSLVGAKRM